MRARVKPHFARLGAKTQIHNTIFIIRVGILKNKYAVSRANMTRS